MAATTLTDTVEIVKKRNAIDRQKAGNALTGRQRSLAELYAQNNNIVKSAKMLSFNKPWQYAKYLQNPQFVQYVHFLRKQFINDYIAQTEYCVMIYKQAIQKARKQNDYRAMADIAKNIASMKQPVTSIKGTVNIQII